jgi:hypothetical protein
VSVEPGEPCTPACPAGEGILQIGIIRCDGDLDVNFNNCIPAQHNNKSAYFIAYGGCNGHKPEAVFTGYTDPVQHQYRIERGTGGSSHWWYLYVDSTLMWQVPDTDEAVNCWLGDNHSQKRIAYYGEGWDRGDSIGTANLGSWFTSMVYRNSSDWWINFNLSTSIPCVNNGEQFQGGASTHTYCDIYGPQAMYMYRP